MFYIAFQAENFIPVPDFSIKKTPCAPGYVVVRKKRGFQDWVRGKPRQYVFTECLWDFLPEYADERRTLLRSSQKFEDNHLHFEYEQSLTIGDVSKSVKVKFKGQEKNSLDDDPERVVLDMTCIDSQNAPDVANNEQFDDKKIFLVTDVVSANLGFIEVKIGDKCLKKTFKARTPLGFKLSKLKLEHIVENRQVVVTKAKPVDSKKFNGEWLDRNIFGIAFLRMLPNRHKYGGGAGDIYPVR